MGKTYQDLEHEYIEAGSHPRPRPRPKTKPKPYRNSDVKDFAESSEATVMIAVSEIRRLNRIIRMWKIALIVSVVLHGVWAIIRYL